MMRVYMASLQLFSLPLTMTIRRQEGHPACNHHISAVPKVFLRVTRHTHRIDFTNRRLSADSFTRYFSFGMRDSLNHGYLLVFDHMLERNEWMTDYLGIPGLTEAASSRATERVDKSYDTDRFKAADRYFHQIKTERFASSSLVKSNFARQSVHLSLYRARRHDIAFAFNQSIAEYLTCYQINDRKPL